MSQLRRRSTPQSIHSHWSDSASIRPSFPIHALAKPLSKFMYQRQAAGIIAENAGSPLSAETAEILATYLTFKDIFPSTRLLVLDHLGSRVLNSKEDTQVVANSSVLGSFSQLLQLYTSNLPILRSTCTLVGHLAQYEESKAMMHGLDLHPQLVPLSSHIDFDVQKAAVSALIALDVVEPLLHCFLLSRRLLTQREIILILGSQARKGEQHARLIVECDTILRDCITKSIWSADRELVELMCKMLLNISEYKVVLMIIADARFITQLTALSSLVVSLQFKIFTHSTSYIIPSWGSDVAGKMANLINILRQWQREKLGELSVGEEEEEYRPGP
ncbi:hypothetical protein B0H16DRAFT_1762659 [Mycena metata]|uniref:Uncharacterized protein n=1 Tax=Mycena metata TaxID=1033252 RepID=A0AAD7MXW6_9AGAR|nr:hypothetical protein B0H16DRAFT_1762659 [Mycena metata]